MHKMDWGWVGKEVISLLAPFDSHLTKGARKAICASTRAWLIWDCAFFLSKTVHQISLQIKDINNYNKKNNHHTERAAVFIQMPPCRYKITIFISKIKKRFEFSFSYFLHFS